MELNPDFWRRCSSCKNPIKYSASYYICSVSTCNRKRVGYVFDSVHCWERHLPGARHKDAAAVEAKSPTYEQWRAELGSDAVIPGGAKPAAAGSMNASDGALSATGSKPPMTPDQQAAAVAASRAPQRVMVRPSGSSGAPGAGVSAVAGAGRAPYRDSLEAEILVVVSKMKNYVKERGDMNTSDSVSNLLSDRIRRLCDRAIDNARAEGRKTIMDRDFEK